MKEPDAAEQVAKALLARERAPDLDWAVLCDMMFSGLSEAARQAVEKMMPTVNGKPYEFKTPWLRDSYNKGRVEGEAHGRVEGEARGRVEGEARGRVEGEARGRVEGEAMALLAVLEARKLAIPSEVRTRIAACTDLSLLEKWLRNAVSASCVDEIFH